MIEVSALTMDDIRQVIEDPRLEGLTFYGVKVSRDGSPVALGAVFGTAEFDWLVFERLGDVPPVTIVRQAKKLIERHEGNKPLVADCDMAIKGADKLLKHLNFRPFEGSYWIHGGSQ